MEEWGTDWSGDVLERIVALLFSLAHLADLAADLSAPRRRHVLGILSVGEAEAWAFVFGTPVPADAPDKADDAARLAARLRALAVVLTVLLMQRFVLPNAAGPRNDRAKRAGPSAGRQASLAAPDTS